MYKPQLFLLLTCIGYLALPTMAEGQVLEEAKTASSFTTQPKSIVDSLDPLKNKFEFSGFSDINLGFPFGPPANGNDRALFDANGVDTFLKNRHKGFGLVGTDFVVLTKLTEQLTYIGEINFQVERGESAEFEVDVERMFVDYRIRSWFNIQAGLYFTPVGFHNRTMYSRAWLKHSIQVPDFDEEELGFTATHTTGAHIYGNFSAFDGHIFGYAVSVGNGRGIDPSQTVYARDTDNFYQLTGLLEWHFPWFRESRLGLSGWFDVINSFVVDSLGQTIDIVSNTAEPMRLRETGFVPFVVLRTELFDFWTEYTWVRQTDLRGNLDQRHFDFHAITAELALNLLKRKLHPYVRYDLTDLPGPDGGPYYSLRLDETELTRFFISEFNGLIFGVGYDLTYNSKLKLEYIRHFDGAHTSNRITAQMAFAF